MIRIFIKGEEVDILDATFIFTVLGIFISYIFGIYFGVIT